MAIVTNLDRLINRRTKIVATVGPASSTRDTLVSLVDAGVNVFRLNMSHGDHAGHKSVYTLIRSVAEELQKPVAVLADLCGPKIRTGRFAGGGIDLVAGETVSITTTQAQGRDGLIVSQYESLATDVTNGDRILLADGVFELKVLESDGENVECEVIQGGRLTDNKGINLPGVKVSAPSLTDKDKQDAEFALQLGVDFIALSFVRTGDDILSLKTLIGSDESAPAIVAKIEKPEALINADEILEVTDAIMIARGDLGVELPPEEVPIAQSHLIDIARDRGKPVIVATQMLESMISHSRPTRAEVTDVSHAVTSGADAVMLSAETAAGKYPVDAVKMMDNIARQTEAHLFASGAWGIQQERHDKSVHAVVAAAAAEMSSKLSARAVIVITQTGASAQTISAARPSAPILASTSSTAVFNRMSLFWGVVPVYETDVGIANPNDVARNIAMSLGLASEGQHILLVRGFRGDKQQSLPSVTVVTI